MTNKIPHIGFGTSGVISSAKPIKIALKIGYRHIDTALGYGNHKLVREGINSCHVPRDEIFLATKTIHPSLSNIKSYNEIINSIRECLDQLSTRYLDLLYIHWPASSVYIPEETLYAFQDLYDENIIKNIGVSNFEPEDLDTVREMLDAPLLANQIECHPLLPQNDLQRYAVENDFYIVAYCPLARGAVFDVPEIKEVSKKHNTSPAQVSLAWLLSRENIVVIPGSASEAHILANYKSDAIDLDKKDIEKINSITRTQRIIDRDYASWNN